MKYYFAYGSNLNIKDMKQRCRNAKIIGKTVLKNYELKYKGFINDSYLTIEKCNDSEVPIGIWMIDDEDERSLDYYEGYPEWYYKKIIELNYNDTIISGLIYIMYENNHIAKPDNSYVDACIKGYEDFGFDVSILEKAYNQYF